MYNNKRFKTPEELLAFVSKFDVRDELPDLPTHTLERDKDGLPIFTTIYKGIVL